MNIWLRCLPCFISRQQFRIEIHVATVCGFTLQFQVKRHMVDTCATVTQRSRIDIEVTRQLFRRSLHRMAQPYLLDMRIAGIHRPGIHRHWVNVVEHGGIGADFRHVLANLPQVRNGT
ncbi:hypothetical protein ExPCM14_01469 [Escherichia coli]|nr:hypothetical protein ExPCM14_01469 [Escherichia coli]